MSRGLIARRPTITELCRVGVALVLLGQCSAHNSALNPKPPPKAQDEQQWHSTSDAEQTCSLYPTKRNAETERRMLLECTYAASTTCLSDLTARSPLNPGPSEVAVLQGSWVQNQRCGLQHSNQTQSLP